MNYNSYKSNTIVEAQKKLENYCAYQERCHKEVKNKLVQLNMIPEAIDLIIVHLIEHNYLNEERYARTFARGKFRIKNWGRQRITLELKRKGISKYNINQGLSEIEEEEYITAFDSLAQRKLESIKETNKLKRKKKLADYLLYRGWESHLVYEKVNSLVN
ncbi:MAG: recombinase RecX [Bacteroidetes bacterium MedPE-SWsnd-G2]|nr:MAG: recombinase RecX [Bacteroidetes bacterium MedPE-SWsnd-G2]